ncbi:hypothetical protein JH26_28405 [Microvirga sp. BSC39]|nr:hypothetical protein JH26_28405 [Microvirga sp. BSC39]
MARWPGDRGKGVDCRLVWPDEAEGGADLPAVDLAGKLNLTIEAIEIDGGDGIEICLTGSGSSQHSVIADLPKGAGNQLAEVGISHDKENGGLDAMRSSGIQNRILQLRSRSWAQGQEKVSDIASSDLLARGARTPLLKGEDGKAWVQDLPAIAAGR